MQGIVGGSGEERENSVYNHTKTEKKCVFLKSHGTLSKIWLQSKFKLLLSD